ncbi:type I polyketide synthase [Microbispora sp. H10949]|uniref:type I polyketide synthase n=1 Tax=Microbispora sp. H10949 TaxID=2729111 RepID=UPI001601AEE3|nr:type I polyketide synthase [Microbispora sp. H10949]
MANEDRLRDYLRRTTADLLRARAELERLEQAAREPLAIVAMACRYPGGVRTPEDLWRLVESGTDAITPFPRDRGWPLDELYDPDPDREGTSYATEGGFLHDAAGFDPELFGISPREAPAVDPQQRLLLQATWEVFERAGLNPRGLTGERVGVFVGVMYSDYASRHARAPEGLEGFVGTGSAGSVASGRIAYTFGLQGPAVTLDTACSSSLVALHYAAQAVRRGDCEMAVAGGATVMATPATFVEFSRQRGLSPDGRCKAYAAAADGTGWAEGVGLVLVERLSEARRKGHPVVAVLRGSAVNSDGASSRLSAPNGAAQQRVVRAALADAGLDPGEVDAVEGHGTGTGLGDPIEANALMEVYGGARPADDPVWLGSLKSNIGHTQAAAGVGGVIKMVLAMRHGVLPASLHIDVPTPHVDWAAGGLAPLTAARPWPERDRARRAAVSSFGISGTNAHVVIEQPPAEADQESGEHPEGQEHPDGRPVVWTVSGDTDRALRDQLTRLREWVSGHPDTRPADVAHTLRTGRADLLHRAVAVGTDLPGLTGALAALEEGLPSPYAASGEAGAPARPVFVFPGQGSQWAGMARELFASWEPFREEMLKCAAALAPHVEWDLVEVVTAPAGGTTGALLDRVDVVQPALFAVMASLTAAWRSLGVEPAAVVGHSQGEIAAAYAAGILDLADAAALVARRSRAIADIAGGGAMASVELAAAELRRRFGDVDGIAVAAVNGPTATVVSGEAGAVRELVSRCEAEGVRARLVPVDYASHSPAVEPLREPLLARLAGIRPRTGHVPFHSTVLAGEVDGAALDAAYWYDNLREPVRLGETVAALVEAGHRCFLEVSPHPVLTAPLRDTAEEAGAAAHVVGTLRRDDGGLDRLLTSAGALFAAGVPVEWGPFTAGSRVDLPTYAFQERRFWLDTVTAAPPAAAPGPSGLPSAGHPVLGVAVEDTGGRRVLFSGVLPAEGWSRQHRLGERRLLPGSGLAELALAAGERVGLSRIEDVTLLAPVEVAEAAVRLQVEVEAAPGGATFAIHARTGEGDAAGPWRLHASGSLAPGDLPGDGPNDLPADLSGVLPGDGDAAGPPGEWPPEGAESLDVEAGYGRLAEAGAHYGPALRAVRAAWARDGEVFAEVFADAATSPATNPITDPAADPVDDPAARVAGPGGHATGPATEGDGYAIHPAALDGAVQAAFLDRVLRAGDDGPPEPVVPFAWSGVRAYTPAAGPLRARVTRTGPDTYALLLTTPDGRAVLTADEVRVRPVPAPEAGRPERPEAPDAYEDRPHPHPHPHLGPALRLRPPRKRALAGHHPGEAGGPAATLAAADGGHAGAHAELKGLTAREREERLLDLVSRGIAGLLGYDSAGEVRPDRPFRDLGLDSLTGVQLRDHLGRALGLRLPSTLVFDHPTPRALARHLSESVAGSETVAETVAETGAETGAAPAVPQARDDAEDPVVIVSMACRYPGGVTTPEELWELLEAGGDAIGEFPADRGWDLATLFDDDPDTPGTSYARRGGFIHDAADFDADFFEMNPREARAADPQQRLLLETSWEAFQRAGIDPTRLRGSRTGVYVGLIYTEYGARAQDDPREHGGYLGTGSAGSVASGRIAYTFGLEGPAITVDTACSSSLVALHLAVRALRAGECDLALVGGATLMATPATFVEFSRQRGLSPDGRCRAFADAADGTGFSEGVGLLLVERLSDARREGHPVLAVVKGTAVNQDGASNGLTAPNGPAQERVIAEALRAAGLAPADVDAVEAHGTGTTLGDPVEARALLRTYGAARGDRPPLRLGSLKSNIGHTQAAAGAGGLIKMILALKHETLPRTLHVDAPSRHVDWDGGGLELVTEAVPWPSGDRPRRFGVSAFGMSGTNAHVIVEEPPAADLGPGLGPDPDSGVEQEPAVAVPLVLSAKSAGALRGEARRLGEYLERHPGVPLADVAAELVRTRAEFGYRAVVVATGREEAIEGLAAVAGGTPSATVVTGHARQARRPVFVYPGQGTQWDGMARALLEESPAFAARIAECAAALDPVTGRSLREALLGGADLGRADVVQPVLWATMTGLTAVWESFGVRPAAVVGHSQGEIAAALAAGALSLEESATVVALRSRALLALSGQGAMLSVAAPADTVRAAVEATGDGTRIAVAAVNGPAATVVAGEAGAVHRLERALRERGVRVRLVEVDYASHSPQVEPLEAELLEVLPEPAPLPEYTADVFSTVTGGRVEPGGETGFGRPAYWYRNLRSPVLLQSAVEAALAAGHEVFIEVSPHPVLGMGVQEILEAAAEDRSTAVVGTLRREDGGLGRVLVSVAEAWVNGVPVDWAAHPPIARRVRTPRRIPTLPTYAFDRRRHWLEPARPAAAPRARGTGHPLLDTVVRPAGEDRVLLLGRVGLDDHPWLAGHAVDGAVLVPGAVLAELASFAGESAGVPRVDELTLTRPLVLEPSGAAEIQVTVGPAEPDGRREIALHARPVPGPAAAADPVADFAADLLGPPWTAHATGFLAPAVPARVNGSRGPAPDGRTGGERPGGAWPPAGAVPLPVAGLYEDLAARGYHYGPAFRGLRSAWRSGDDVVAEVSLEVPAGFRVAPTLLDAALHALGPAGLFPDDGAVRLPFTWRGFTLHGRAPGTVRVRLGRAGDGAVAVELATAEGVPVASVEAVTLRAADPADLAAASVGDALHELVWEAVSPGSGVPRERVWALGTDAEADHPDLDAALAALDAGSPAPDVLVLDVPSAPREGDVPEAVRAALLEVLGTLRRGLADPRLGGTLFAVRTRDAVAAAPGDAVDALDGAAVWGLVRSAQSEEPGRIALVDAGSAPLARVLDAVATGEPQTAVRNGLPLAPRLTTRRPDLVRPRGAWRLEAGEGGVAEDLVCRPVEERPLGPGEVRVAVRASGLNFRDAMLVLGMYPGSADLGTEGAGVVAEVGDGVTGLVPGDRVMGLVPGGVGPSAVTDHRLLAPIPPGLTFAQAATVPAVFLTAYYALRDLAGARPGERLLVHSAAGGVGGAAIQLARHWGLTVFGTASPAKWPHLERAGLPREHVANSRDLSFTEAVRAATGGRGVDIVLNSLAREFVDASLGLLAPGGRFVEMGKTDVRDPGEIDDRHGVLYRAFDLAEAGPDRIAVMLAEIAALLAEGVLTPLPVTAWQTGRAPEAVRHLGLARHVGKVALRVPRPLDPEGTVLVTGGTGGLGRLVATHLARAHGIRHLLLVSRQGERAPGVEALRAELGALGAHLTVVAADVADRAALAGVLAAVPTGHPLTGVVHAAGVLDDATLATLTPERLDAVLRPKADGAWHLHELTRELDLAAFVLFSSAAGIVGSPGQAAYAAANVFLDALAAARAQQGLPATSVAWGLWRSDSAMTGALTAADRARMARSGLLPLAPEHALSLLDAALDAAAPALAAVRLDPARLAAIPDLAAPLRALARRGSSAPAPATPKSDEGSGDSGGLPALLAAADPERRRELVTETVLRNVEAVLGRAPEDDAGERRSFKELGFDSLTAVELRNRLGKATGLRLPATVVFDQPTPDALAAYLLRRLVPDDPEPAAPAPSAADTTEEIPATAEELFRFIDSELRSEGRRHV